MYDGNDGIIKSDDEFVGGDNNGIVPNVFDNDEEFGSNNKL